MAAQWWLQRFLQDGGTLILSETGKVGYFTPEDDAEQAERFRALHEERVALDADLLAEKAGLLAWQGLGALGLYHQTIAGRRWAIVWQANRTEETCIITTEIVIDRPFRQGSAGA